MIGRTLSHFEILERLGGSRADALYRARDREDGSTVVVRLLSGLEPPELRRLLRDARAATRLDHPNLCTIFEVAEVDGSLLLAMPFVAGESLASRLTRGALPAASAAQLALQAVAGLIEAHEQGVVHGDLRPSNLRLDPAERLKVVGFEPAGAISGVTPYRAPEQLRGEPPGVASDVWALGAVLFAMVLGRPPFAAADEEALVQAILHDEPAWPGEEEPEAAALLSIAATALAKLPAERYPGLDDLWRDLQAAREAEEGAAAAGEEDGATERVVPVSHSTGARSGSRAATRPRPSLVGPNVHHYRILERLGSGGMGVVYKAQDTRLERTVALKFLPPELTRNPHAKARFLREAKAASALDHPNICTVHEVGETADGQLYLAMSCYDGETLKRKIERGPLPIDEAVDIAWQTAQGLAKAHRQGIVHRDVKPANLIVTADGIVKILDFGLAKLAGAAGLTRAGFSLGTPAYMSPEQVRGEVDRRTDVWSLGVVLYEMVAGVAPFRGDNDQAVLYNLVTEEPVALSDLRSDVPPGLLRIVARLLAKAPDDRYPSLEGVAADLRGLLGPTSSAALPVHGAAGPPVRRGGRRLWPWLVAALAVAAAVAGTFALRSLLAHGAVSWVSAKKVTDQEGREWFPSLDRDCTSVVYSRGPRGNHDIYLQHLDGSPRNLTADSPRDDTEPAFSPDGQRIVFRSERDGGGLFLMGALGDSVRHLTAEGYNPAWSRDGKEVAYATGNVTDPTMRTTLSSIVRIDVETGQKRVVTGGDAVQPSWSPNGWRIAYWGLLPDTSQRVVWTVPAAGGRPVRVTDESFAASVNWNPVWSPDGRHLYFASDRDGNMNFFRVPIDEPSGRVAGPAEAVTVPAQSSALLSFCRDGRQVAYATDDTRENLQRIAFDPATSRVTGDPVPITEGSKRVRSADVSPDGRWITYDTTVPPEGLFVMRVNGADLLPLPIGPARKRIPRWSPDGQSILFYSDRDGVYEPWTIDRKGIGLTHLVHYRSGPSSAIYYPLWSPDGRRIACSLSDEAALIDCTLPLARRLPQPLPPIPGGDDVFAPTSWSPDGARLAGTAQARRTSASSGIILYSLAARSYERLSGRGEFPVWLHDSRRLLYVDDGGIYLLDTRTRQSRLLLTPSGHSRFTRVIPAPDDRTLYVISSTDEGDIWLLESRDPL